MKNFMYLNMDFLESFMAQNNDGFPEQEELEENHSHTEDEEDEKGKIAAKVNGGLDAKIAKINGDVSVEIIDPIYRTTDVETVRNIVIKTHKDNMFNTFYQYIKDENLLAEKSKLSIGKFISITDEFFYFDFSRILNLYKEEYRQLYEKNNTEDFDFSCDKFKMIREKISFLKEILPFDAFLHRDNLLVLIDKKWLRIKRKHIGYKFQGEIHIIGRIDKFAGIKNSNNTPNVIETLNKIQEISLSMLYELGLLVSKEVYLITPIAIYY